jgi:hypothetical protein
VDVQLVAIFSEIFGPEERSMVEMAIATHDDAAQYLYKTV